MVYYEYNNVAIYHPEYYFSAFRHATDYCALYEQGQWE